MTDIQSIPLTRIDGSAATLGDYAGKVLLIVNTASKCGLTKQYEGLEALYRARKDDGLEILGFPANNFMEQEPGSNEDIASFCTLTYDVTFPMFAKRSVKGADIAPLYTALTEAQPQAIGTEGFRQRLAESGIDTGSPSEVLWNFEKFLVSRDGAVIGRFSPGMTVADPVITEAIDTALG
jgi:glutathione peroxidase